MRAAPWRLTKKAHDKQARNDDRTEKEKHHHQRRERERRVRMKSIKFHISITFIHSNGNVLGIRAEKETNKTATSWQIQIRRLWGESFYSHQQCGSEKKEEKVGEALSVSNKFLLRLSFKSLVNTFSFSYSILTLRCAKLRKLKISPRGVGEKAQLSDSHVKNLFFLPLFFSSAHIFRLILSLDFLFCTRCVSAEIMQIIH